MKIAVTGSSGLIGTALVPALGGNEIVSIRRGAAWNPETGVLDPELIRGAEAVVHLAGENVAARKWTRAQKARIRDSRVKGTAALARTLAQFQAKPRVFISASAVGYYGDRGDEILTERSDCGDGFLADVCREWEEATRPAAEAGIRVVNARFGIVLASSGGPLARMLPIFKLGAGGPTGHGRQYVSWIALEDAVAALRHALSAEPLSGPVNVVAPEPVTNAVFAKTLGHVLGRPAVVPAIPFMLRMAFGEMVDEVLLASQRAVPNALAEEGFKFRYPLLETALRAVIHSR